MATVSSNVGFAQNSGTFTIGSGATGSAVTAVDLGRNYAFITVSCNDAQYIQAATTMTIKISRETANTNMNSLWKQDGSGAWTSGTLPTSGGFTFALPDAFGARHVQVILSQNSGAGSVVFTIRGFDPAVS